MSETPLTCANCGAAVEANHDFCPKCGNALRTAPPPVPAGPPPLPGKPAPVLAIALCVLAGVLLLAAAAFFLSAKGEGGEAASAQPVPAGVSGGGGSGQEGTAASGAASAPVQEHPLSGTFRCRRGAEFDVDPEDAIVAIDDVVIGKADDFDGSGGGRVYYFRGPGEYIARFSLKGYRTAWVKIIVSPSASEEVISVDTELRER